MSKRCGLVASGLCLIASSLFCASAGNAPGTPTSVLVTVEGKGDTRRVLSEEDVKVQEDKDSRPITSFRHVDSAAATQMLLLIDDSAGGSFNTQIQDLKTFVQTLPTSVEIGVGYMRNGLSQMACEFTQDHAKAASSIRIAEGMGGADVSPYDSLSEAVNKWPRTDARREVMRREVIMISSGMEGLGGGLPPDNPYVNAGIASAQKAGVTVYAIYNPSFGHEGHSFWRAAWGQNFLSQLADETGGELYEVGTGSSVSFEPYLADILKRQSDQYILTFEARAEKKSGLQSVKIRSAVKNISLAAPDKVFVKASL